LFFLGWARLDNRLVSSGWARPVASSLQAVKRFIFIFILYLGLDGIYMAGERIRMKLPFKIMLSDPASKHALETVTNPYSGQSCQLPRYAVAVYDTIKGAEVTGDVDLMRKGLTWFQKNFTDQYYVLLD